MKRVVAISLWLSVGTLASAGAVPSQITYQGTISEQGTPVTGKRTMLFRITDSAGSSPAYWSSGNIDVVVTNGLFSQVLSPTGVDWQNVTPYIELSVGPQGQTPALMLPREPLTATAYSFMSGTVVDGSIVVAKLDPSVSNYLIPSGMVALFTTPTCPAGWTEVTALRGRTAFGVDPGNPAQFTLGQQGGSLTHTHTFTTSTDGAHSHGGSTGSTTGPGGTANSFSSGASDFPLYGDKFPIASDGAHHHTGQTDPTSTLPSYTTMLYCSKS